MGRAQTGSVFLSRVRNRQKSSEVTGVVSGQERGFGKTQEIKPFALLGW